MAKLGINTGSAPDAGDGDSLQQGAVKINSNFDEVYTLLGNGTALAPGIVTSIVGGNNIAVSTSVGQVTLTVTGNTWDDNTTGINTLSNVGIGTTNATDELKVSGTVKTDQIVVVGVSTFQNDVNFNYDLTIGEDASLERNLKVTGVSTFVGESNFNDSVLITGITTCSNDLDVSNDIIVGGGVSISGVSTFAGITTVTGQTLFSKQLSISGISSIGGNIIVGHNPSTQGSGSILKANELNLTGPNSSDSNSTFYSNIRANKVGGGFKYDLEFHSNGYSSGDIGDFIFYKRGTSSQRTERMRLTGEDGNLTVTGSVTAASFVGDGSGLSGINATGTGVSVSDGGSFIGVASAINFGNNLSVSPISAGIVTITGQAGGGSTDTLTTVTGRGAATTNAITVGGLTVDGAGNNVGKLDITDQGNYSQIQFYNNSGDAKVSLKGVSDNLYIEGGGGNIRLHTYGLFYSNGDVTLNSGGNGGTDIEGTLNVSGVSTFSGDIKTDGSNIVLGLSGGASDDRIKLSTSEIYQDTNGFRIIGNTGGISLRADGTNGWSNAAGNEDYIVAIQNAQVQLYYDNSKKFETTGAGVTVTGTAFSNQLNVSGVSTFTGYTTFENHLSLGDNDEIRLGSSNLMKMYYSSAGDVGAFVQSLNNDLHLVGSTSGGVRIITYNQDSLVANRLGSVDLYHNGSKKFETTGAGVTITGVCTATSFVGDISTATAGKWTLGANGNSDYTFTGIGFTQTTNDPVLYLARGRVYEFVNGMGAHPFEIRVSAGGAAYNAGVTNNAVSNGTLRFEIPMDAPNTLYYQCTSHSGMGNTISVYPNTI